MNRSIYRTGMSILLILGAGAASETANAAAPDPKLMVGVFENHGVAHPKDPKTARAMRLWVQRRATVCRVGYNQRGGGSGESDTTCDAGRFPGSDATAAIFDALDDARTPVDRMYDGSRFAELTRMLAKTRQAKIVPILVTALERLAARSEHADAYNPLAEQAIDKKFNAVAETLTALTHRRATLEKKANWTDRAAWWRKWIDTHRGQTRAAWAAEATTNAERLVQSGSKEAASEALVILLKDRATRARARALANRLKQRVGELPWELRQALKSR